MELGNIMFNKVRHTQKEKGCTFFLMWKTDTNTNMIILMYIYTCIYIYIYIYTHILGGRKRVRKSLD
jgi:hypothetical protein